MTSLPLPLTKSRDLLMAGGGGGGRTAGDVMLAVDDRFGDVTADGAGLLAFAFTKREYFHSIMLILKYAISTF